MKSSPPAPGGTAAASRISWSYGTPGASVSRNHLSEPPALSMQPVMHHPATPVAEHIRCVRPASGALTSSAGHEACAMMTPLVPNAAATKPGRLDLVDDRLGRHLERHAEGGIPAAGHPPRVAACLDVTEPEPLPKDHPLWLHPRVLITPHVAADAELSGERAFAVLQENLRRFGAGEPLVNVVDKQAGY